MQRFSCGQNVGAKPSGIFSVKVGFSGRDECDHNVKPSHVNFDLLFLPCDTVIAKTYTPNIILIRCGISRKILNAEYLARSKRDTIAE